MELNLIPGIAIVALVTLTVHWFVTCWYISAFKILLGRRPEMRYTNTERALQRVQRAMERFTERGAMITTARSQRLWLALVTVVFVTQCSLWLVIPWVVMVFLWDGSWGMLEDLVDDYRRQMLQSRR